MDQQFRLYKEFYENNLDAMVYPEQKNLVVPIGSPSQKVGLGLIYTCMCVFIYISMCVYIYIYIYIYIYT
jgi:hypothetical protein